ncbi:kinesin-like protein KIN-12B [Malania oleifera]|uniref:kinesin-like protein KIN-12B n=1 Tax=Malania oleifera TaxID=397392 RepID=UPI0025AE7EAE|nr:kinesin-like protein KIN-12B [Malania oleifera]
MKHPMQPRTTILRENHPESAQQSPNLNSLKQRQPSSSRKQKSAKENAPPSDLTSTPDPSPSTTGKHLPPSAGKIKSPLPPRPPSANSNPHKRKLSMESAPDSSPPGVSDSGVKVIVRMRPPKKDEEEGETIVQKVCSDSLSILGQTYTFDSVADTEATQLDIFQLVGAPLVEHCLAGFNSSVFAYGQTGSGKTYTMWGPTNALVEENASSDQKGLTPRVIEWLFARISEEQIKHADKQLKYQCRCSFFEIYNEQITDLLDPNQRNLQIREDVKSGVYVENLTEECVCTMRDLSQLLMKGLSNRRTGATSINAESSRSHSVFTCIVESRCKSMADGISSFKTSRINLVDLAGSERQKLTGAAGECLKEAGNINRSLSQLGNLINILAEVSQTGKQRHIPYRNSKLTFLLQESLGGNAKLAMVCAVSPAPSCKSETFSTLRFAQRAKAIKNKAVVNEVMQDDVNSLREVIRQLRDELLRMKANSNQTDSKGGYSTGWTARRSLNLLKFSLNRPTMLHHVDDDGDEVMEIDEEAVEKLCNQVGLQQSAGSEEDNSTFDLSKSETVLSNPKLEASNEDDINMEEALEDRDINTEGGMSEQLAKHENMNVDCNECVSNASFDSMADTLSHCNQQEGSYKEMLPLVIDNKQGGDSFVQPAVDKELLTSPVCTSQNEECPSKLAWSGLKCTLSDPVGQHFADVSVADAPNSSANASLDCISPDLSIVPCEVSPVLKSPIPSVSPRVHNCSRKSLKTSSMLTASQKDSKEDSRLGPDALRISFVKSRKSCSPDAPSMQTSKSFLAPTEHLATSLHRGLEILENHRQSSALRRSSFRFSFNAADSFKPVLPAGKVEVGVQTVPQDNETTDEDMVVLFCHKCKSRTRLEIEESNDNASMQLVPVDGLHSNGKSKKKVPKAVEKVLAGAFRREIALQDFCAKQTSEIMQLNRLVQQYRHERECNAIIGQTREDKILRLESLMDGVLPTAEFMEEELVSLINEHKLLKEKYENHPEVLTTKIELKRVQDELERYRNFFDLGEREVLLEEIQYLRSQLQYYVDSSSVSFRKHSPLLQLTYSCEPSVAPPLSTIPESTEESAEAKLEQERVHWTEVESKWISLAEELKTELEASRSLAEKHKQEVDSEKKCSEELKEAMQLAMEGHARMLEQYADLEEKHIQLLSRHRKIQDGINDVKKAAAKAGVKGAESRFINALAAEISALKVEKEKERQYLREENKGLRTQLRDTAEAVQAAGELLVRLKEAEEAVAAANRRTEEAEQETEKAYKQVDKLKKKHEKEIKTLNQLLAESRLPKEALDDGAKNGAGDSHGAAGDQRWKEEFEPFFKDEDGELSRLAEPSSWFSGYDRCNI